ncbi:MAG: protease complex subunit PrcB family protein [Chlorobia bacterium]|nr:protease complex subunit PrcB family protein [Fimbriimonadaceae bacterium]
MNPWSLIAKTAMVVALVCSFVPTRSQGGRQDMVTWRTYRQGAFSNAKGTLTNVFETEGQFQTYWERVNGPIAGKVPTSGVDWAREKLIAVNLGPRANPGYEVVVSSIKRVKTGEILVTFQEQLPVPGMRYPQVVISPFIIVKMERTTGVISFKGETVRRSTGVIITPPGGRCCVGVCRCCENCGCSCREGG